jgi:hypothetical protein
MRFGPLEIMILLVIGIIVLGIILTVKFLIRKKNKEQ